MKKLFALLLALCLVLALVPTLAEEESAGLTILSENFIARAGYSNLEGIYMAKVQNATDKVLYLTEGSLALFDADFNLVGTSKSLYPCGSHYLEPGEITLLCMTAKVDEGATVAEYKANIKSAEKAYYSEDKAVTVTGTDLSIDYSYNNYALVTVSTGEEALAGIHVILAVEDAEGNILDITTKEHYRDVLGANSTFTFWASLDSNTLKYCQENGIVPTQVEAFGWVEIAK